MSELPAGICVWRQCLLTFIFGGDASCRGSFWSNFFGRGRGRKGGSDKPQPRTLSLETLEDRRVLSAALVLDGSFLADLNPPVAGQTMASYVVSGGHSLDLNSQVLRVQLPAGFSSAAGAVFTVVQNNSGEGTQAVVGHFTNPSTGQALLNGSVVDATDANGNVITYPNGAAVEFCIYYPGGESGSDGTSADDAGQSNQNVSLVCQGPTATASNAAFLGPRNTAAANLTPTTVTSATTLTMAFNAELGGVGVGNSSEYVLASGGSLNLNNETLSLSYIDGYLPAVGDRITLVQNNTGSAGAITGYFKDSSGRRWRTARRFAPRTRAAT